MWVIHVLRVREEEVGFCSDSGGEEGGRIDTNIYYDYHRFIHITVRMGVKSNRSLEDLKMYISQPQSVL